ncbi:MULTISPECIES: DNA topoisomerase IB [unclassified Chelatococcus]|uniref:DNA topoisomerase IB n=1 Tax=unclassified Chelatococcus TaxID=2638111 RepID=UPI001BCD9CA6|nr:MULTISPECIES: DNA topoisomerase IB [unclassified Chelatococcus]MBS7742832.1 DNA topoisomerase IB [Chelatococcus sp. HY11]MBX3542050.1 DNA topoisomerase IB [Chelatococcus sp.]CAH1654050.1 DNA topoisomerase IB (poxvirus type) [Hyphomicrobiales bacterium]CAH1694745.1 DNA topoisomerase IB (poxvirus type) [Hyphomicrobiales bacterium]
MTPKTGIRRLARRFELRIVSPDELVIIRRPRGRGFSYETQDGKSIKNARVLSQLKQLAVPPAYRNVRFAADPRAHLQAIGEDAAGRLQYRYHPDWTLVRETLKAHRLSGLAQALPKILSYVRRELRRPVTEKRFALAAVVQLVALTAIRAGGDEYAQERGTRGATTLLKSHVKIDGDEVRLAFTGKGGKAIQKAVRNAELARALVRLKEIPGSRLFKHRDGDGTVRAVRASEVNDWLKEISGHAISLKDFRTLTASLGVLDELGRLEPENSERDRRRQIREAIAPLADELANTLTVCRTSYVHDSVIAAFENGRLGKACRPSRSASARMQLLARLLRSNACRPQPLSLS